MIQLAGVTRSFGRNVAVAGLDLMVSQGELFALLGRNGAGKTTTLKLLVGLLQPDRGVVRVCGRDVTEDPAATNRMIGYIPDQPRLYDKLTGHEFLMFVAQLYGLDVPAARAAVDQQVEQFQLGRFLHQLTESYSHGMKQRTVFAAALLHNPAVLVVDEPMVGLDPHTVVIVKKLLRSQAAEGKTVIVSTHTLSVAQEIAGRIGVMDRGKLVFEGTLAELRDRCCSQAMTLEELYLELVPVGE